MLNILHDLNILEYHYSQGIRYLGSCRIFSIYRREAQHNLSWLLVDFMLTLKLAAAAWHPQVLFLHRHPLVPYTLGSVDSFLTGA